MVGDRGVEGLDDVVVESSQARANLCEFKRLAVSYERIRVHDGVEALSLSETRVNYRGQAAKFHR